MDYTKSNVNEFGVINPKYYPNLVAAVMEKTEAFQVGFVVAPFETEKIKFFTENSDGFNVEGCEMILIYNFEKVIRAYLGAKLSTQSFATVCLPYLSMANTATKSFA